MKQRGSKSAASLAIPAIDGRPSRLKPPASLSKAEQAIFIDIVSSTSAGHFVASDVPLLCAYARAVFEEELAGRELRRGGHVVNGRPSPWITVQEKAVRAITALSMRLRLSPQARKQYAAAPSKPMSYYERMRLEGDADED
jgi:hypothetical protein